MNDVKPRRKLSKSACATYAQCSAGYDYHYNKGIRSIKTDSPLVFGNGIDQGLNAILLKTGDPMDAFVKEFEKFPAGSIVPNVNDYDGELMSPEAKAFMLESIRQYGYAGDDVDGLAHTLLARIKAGEELSENQHKAVDLLCRGSLGCKARLMFDAYREKVLPRITRVYNVQKPSGPGFLDATVEWSGVGKVVMDHKTSGKAYPPDACDYSLELALYAGEEKVNNVAYVVLMKQIRKNRVKTCEICGHIGTGSHKTCDAITDVTDDGRGAKRCGGEWTVTILPEADIQVVHGEITPRALEVAAEVQTQIQKAVDEKIFFCNFAQCNSQFGKQCKYKRLHWHGDMTGLEVKSKDKK
jgi:hypothetical protein